MAGPNGQLASTLGSIEVSAVRSNYHFWAKKPTVISFFKLQLTVIRKILICSLQQLAKVQK